MDLRNTTVDTSLDLGINSFQRINGSSSSSVLKSYRSDSSNEAGKRGVHHFDDNMRKESQFDHEDDLRVQEIKRISLENKKLNDALNLLTEKYNALRSQVKDPERHEIPENEAATVTTLTSRKRKLEDTDRDNNNMIRIHENGNACYHSQEMWKGPKESIVKPNVSNYLVPTDASDTSLVVKDGYVWRKYGQKVTRDNPSPRAYFKCSLAPNCPAKKKVQRSVENPSFLEVIYEGEHNHKCPSQAQLSPNTPKVSNIHSLPIVAPERPNTSKSNTIHDMVQQSPRPTCTSPPKQDQVDHAPPPLPQLLAQQMALSLTKDPNFTSALIDAISGKVLEEVGGMESW